MEKYLVLFLEVLQKIKNYLQIGNKLHVNFSSKSENKIGYFKLKYHKLYLQSILMIFKSFLALHLQ